jgi:hypothetical protein
LSSNAISKEDVLEPVADALNLVRISLERSLLLGDEQVSGLLVRAVDDLADTIELIQVPSMEQSRVAVLSLVASEAD